MFNRNLFDNSENLVDLHTFITEQIFVVIHGSVVCFCKVLNKSFLQFLQSYESIKRSKIRSLFCPSCHQQVELGSLGISGLFR